MMSRKARRFTPTEVYAMFIVGSLCLLTAYEVMQRSLPRSSNDGAWDESQQTDVDFQESEDQEPSGQALTCTAASNRMHVPYDGEVLEAKIPQPTADECCVSCAARPGCNAWNWCGNVKGCGQHDLFMECTLKKSSLQAVVAIEGFSQTKVGWVSGTGFTSADKSALRAKEQRRLHDLRHKSHLPLVYLDISIKGWMVGRIEIVLYKDVAPKAAENFRALCTGEKGVVPKGHKGAGTEYSFKGKMFYLLVDKLMNVAGAGTDSVYGGAFADETGGLAMKHDRKGIVTMVNDAEDMNTSDFAIMIMPARSLDHKYTVFGEVVSGLEVVYTMNELARGRPHNTAGVEEQVKIVDSGEIHRRW